MAFGQSTEWTWRSLIDEKVVIKGLKKFCQSVFYAATDV